jgi:hypothetical protein
VLILDSASGLGAFAVRFDTAPGAGGPMDIKSGVGAKRIRV